MEYIKKEDLKDGDIFVSQMSHNHFLNKYGTGFSLRLNLDNTIKNLLLYKNGGFVYHNMRLATPEEKHWLNECIKLDKFITFKEAMKTFIPEYVECIQNTSKDFYTLNKIYKITNKTNYPKILSIISDKGCGIEIINWSEDFINVGNNCFKPSTKEAYDAQFKTKEVVKVKPFEILETCRKNPNRIKQVINEEGNIFMIGDIITPTITDSPNKGKGFKIIGFRLNKDKSMICAITNTHTPYGIGIDKIEHFIEKDVFVLPEKWCIKNIDKKIGEYFDKLTNSRSLYTTNYYNKYLHSYGSSNNKLGTKGYYNYSNDIVRNEFTEITFEQFKKYVLKEETRIEFGNKIEEKVIEPLPQFKIIETIETITKVENNEGNQFFIGDVVKSAKLKNVKITGFNLSTNKKNIIASLNNGLHCGINKLEHYIEPKISLDDIKKRYPIGTFVKSVVSSKIIEIKDYSLFHSNTNGDVLSYNQGSIILYQNEIWAKEETLLEKAKRLYPVGTIFCNKNLIPHCTLNIKVTGNSFHNHGSNEIRISNFHTDKSGSFTVYLNGQWAEIIEGEPKNK